MSPWLIYWWSQADVLRDMLGVSSLGVLVVIGGVAAMMAGEGVEIPRWMRAATVASALCGIVSLLIPSSRTIALMYVLPRVAESDVIQRDMPELYGLAIDALKAELASGIGGGDE